MTAVQPDAIVDRIVSLLNAVDQYDLLSNGLREKAREIVPGDPADVRQMDQARVAEVLFDIVNLFRWRRLEPVLALHDLPHPRYPVGALSPSAAPPPVAAWDPPRGFEPPLRGWKFLGFDVGFPIGIPSCELTCNADWIEFYARKGFHVLTYRTVRSQPTYGSSYDWVYLADIEGPWDAQHTPDEVRRDEQTVPRNWRTASTATSFIAPSLAPAMWEADMRDAVQRLKALGGHHLLIASITDSVPAHEKNAETLAANFVDVALRAEAAGAPVIECYLARANARDASGGLKPCEANRETSIAIVEAVRSALKPDTRLLIKLSGDLPAESLEEMIVPLAKRRLIDGVSGVSPVRVKRVMTGTNGTVLWDEKGPGVAGYALRDISSRFVRELVQLRKKHGLRFEIVAMGGVMTAEDVSAHLHAGASVVQAATAAVTNPSLAIEAFAHYRPTVEASENWDGVVDQIDEDGGKFWARLVRTDQDAPDEEAQFELAEFRPDERSRIQPGTIFNWRTGLLLQGGELVRQSAVRLKEVRALTEDDHLEGKKLAEWVAESSDPAPGLS